MFPPRPPSWLRRVAVLGAVALLAGCAIAKPRSDDPLEKYNRKAYAFNDALDKAVIRPVAVGYRKVTNPPVRRSVNDFFTNLRMPVTVANDLLQARPVHALQSTSRFLINLTLGIGGLFDPASSLGLPIENSDFGVTLARWGVPEGAYLMLPFLGPSTTRDVWQVPVDGYFFDPLSIYIRTHGYHYGQEYLPQLVYLVNLRSRAFDAEGFLQSAYDPYVFVRDAYRQRRLYKIYDGNPPARLIEQMQGLDDSFDPDQLLEEQHRWEKKHPDQANAPGGKG
ncbi:MAG TPA: VacJ family lipoprotein [Dyella sp.]|nr:VacJ family lipoprotein [Dyella sp.]